MKKLTNVSLVILLTFGLSGIALAATDNASSTVLTITFMLKRGGVTLSK